MSSPVAFVVSLHHSPLSVSLAALDDRVALGEELEAEGLAVEVVNQPDLDVLEGDDALGHILGGVLEVVEAAVAEHEPPALPALPTEKKDRQMLLVSARGKF